MESAQIFRNRQQQSAKRAKNARMRAPEANTLQACVGFSHFLFVDEFVFSVRVPLLKLQQCLYVQVCAIHRIQHSIDSAFMMIKL